MALPLRKKRPPVEQKEEEVSATPRAITTGGRRSFRYITCFRGSRQGLFPENHKNIDLFLGLFLNQKHLF